MFVSRGKMLFENVRVPLKSLATSLHWKICMRQNYRELLLAGQKNCNNVISTLLDEIFEAVAVFLSSVLSQWCNEYTQFMYVFKCYFLVSFALPVHCNPLMISADSWVFLDTFPTCLAAFSPVPRISPASVCPNKRNKRTLYSSTDYDPNKLQRLQNTAARLI